MSEGDAPTRSLSWDEPARGPTLLLVWDGGLLRREVAPGASLRVGRGAECEIQILHHSLSRQHAVFRWDAAPTIADLGSTHGTRVGGRVLRRGEVAPLGPGVVAEAGPVTIVFQGESAGPMSVARAASVEKLLVAVAKTKLAIVLFGETGVGKEVAAERIHELSPRRRGPLVRINCGAIAETLLESELFGHERGAFTGADRTRPGLIESADGGTLFLDEVGELPMVTQVKLLRVLENQEVRRVGAVKSARVDVRVVSATHRDLRLLVHEGRFREDLYYRLNGVTVALPALRERVGEIETLARTFAGATPIHEEALRVLLRHRWPGNVRELKNVIERALALAEEGKPIGASDILIDSPFAPSAQASPRVTLGDEISELERSRIVAALDSANGNQTKAAEILGITRRTLILRMETFGLPRPRKK